MAYNDSFSGSLIHHPCRDVSFENYPMLVLMKQIDWNRKPHKDNYNVESLPSYEISEKFYDNIQFHWIKLRAALSCDYFQSTVALI